MELNIIVAIDSNFLIGDSETNSLPWPRSEYKEDMKHFRNITSKIDRNTHNYLICGYNTGESMKGIKLKNRRLVVIDKTAIGTEYTSTEGPIKVRNFPQALIICNKAIQLNLCDKVFVIGGKKCIEQALRSAELGTIYLTQIKKSFKGDVFLSREKYFNNFKLTKVEKIKNMHFCEYKRNLKEHQEYQYIDLISNILNNGIDCDDRTGTGIKSIFGTQMKFDLTLSFPLLTTKKMFVRGITEELLWFLRGETDNKILQEKRVHIWDGNSTREFLDKVGLNHLEKGDIGAAYGFQFRHFGAKYIDCNTDYTGQGFDQVAYVLDLIKNNPNSRRIVLSLWNPPDLHKAVLPPCHMMYQFRVYNNTLSCSMYQRSGDIGLGVPFNIASAALMTHLFAHMTGLKPRELTHTIGDAHIYNNHIEAMKEQIQRCPLPFPKLKMKNRDQKNIEDYLASDFELLGYMSHPKVKMSMAV